MVLFTFLKHIVHPFSIFIYRLKFFFLMREYNLVKFHGFKSRHEQRCVKCIENVLATKLKMTTNNDNNIIIESCHPRISRPRYENLFNEMLLASVHAS